MRPPRYLSQRQYNGRSSSLNSNRSSIDVKQVTLAIAVMCLSFYLGAISGKHAVSLRDCVQSSPLELALKNSMKEEEEIMDIEKIDKLVEEKLKAAREKLHAKKQMNVEIKKDDKRFPPSMNGYANGIVKVSKREFMDTFDYGVPADHSDAGMQDAFIIYNSEKALPNKDLRRTSVHTTGPIPAAPVLDATENCDAMNVVYTDSNRKKNQCLVIVKNYEAYHIQKWLRLDKGKVDLKNPLVPVPRNLDALRGASFFKPPTESAIMNNFKMMKRYLDSLEDILGRLRPITTKIAKEHTIIVMIVNKGQSELLTNFVCASRANGFDLSNVLVFATDEDTREIVTQLGLDVFYDETLFGEMPEKQANFYGDRTFSAMMYAKVLCVQLINYLGYDVLFQDVDMVWLKDPFELLHDKNSPLNKFDILFQDDGVRSVRYAPYSANTGFYYVRSNQKTKYLFISLLYAGDLIATCHSHQQALAALLIEHSSLYGLRVKVIDGTTLPGGYHYHNRPAYMRKIIAKEADPYIFHMSWTENKDNKLKFMKQMGWWYVNERCYEKVLADTNGADAASCCLAEPAVKCFYSDKPSIIPCKSSPQIDKTGRPFWK